MVIYCPQCGRSTDNDTPYWFPLSSGKYCEKCYQGTKEPPSPEQLHKRAHVGRFGYLRLQSINNGYLLHTDYDTLVFNDFRDLTDWLWNNLPQHGYKGKRID